MSGEVNHGSLIITSASRATFIRAFYRRFVLIFTLPSPPRGTLKHSTECSDFIRSMGHPANH